MKAEAPCGNKSRDTGEVLLNRLSGGNFSTKTEVPSTTTSSSLTTPEATVKFPSVAELISLTPLSLIKKLPPFPY